MGKMGTITKDYMSIPEYFADGFNYYLFNGKQVSRAAKKHRENKEFKSSAEFLSGFTKDDKLKPVITLTIYFGSDDWDGPRSLKEMFEEMDEEIMKFVEDYHIHLIVPKEIEDFSKFATDLGKAMKYIAVSPNKEALEELQTDAAFKEVDVKTVQLLNACTGSNIPISEGKEKVNMCKGLEGLIQDGILEERRRLILNALQGGSSAQDIAEILRISLDEVQAVENAMLQTA